MNRTSGLLMMGMLAAMLVAGATVVSAQDEEDNRAVNWLTYREAMHAGQSEGKPILLHFTAGYSPICRKMKLETYKDRQVIRYLNRNFAVAMVDIETLPSLARKYKVESLPTLWFLDPEGKALTSINGEVGPQKMLRVTEYIREKIYETTDYKTWLDKRSGH